MFLHFFDDFPRHSHAHMFKISRWLDSIAKKYKLGDQLHFTVHDDSFELHMQDKQKVGLVVLKSALKELERVELSIKKNKRRDNQEAKCCTIKTGAITKTGNKHARKALIEAAWAYRMQPRVSRALKKRQEKLTDPIRQIAWKAQLRLCARFKKLMVKGKSNKLVVTAIARELSAFLWAMAKHKQLMA